MSTLSAIEYSDSLGVATILQYHTMMTLPPNMRAIVIAGYLGGMKTFLLEIMGADYGAYFYAIIESMVYQDSLRANQLMKESSSSSAAKEVEVEEGSEMKMEMFPTKMTTGFREPPRSVLGKKRRLSLFPSSSSSSSLSSKRQATYAHQDVYPPPPLSEKSKLEEAKDALDWIRRASIIGATGAAVGAVLYFDITAPGFVMGNWTPYWISAGMRYWLYPCLLKYFSAGSAGGIMLRIFSYVSLTQALMKTLAAIYHLSTLSAHLSFGASLTTDLTEKLASIESARRQPGLFQKVGKTADVIVSETQEAFQNLKSTVKHAADAIYNTASEVGGIFSNWWKKPDVVEKAVELSGSVINSTLSLETAIVGSDGGPAPAICDIYNFPAKMAALSRPSMTYLHRYVPTIADMTTGGKETIPSAAIGEKMSAYTMSHIRMAISGVTKKLLLDASATYYEGWQVLADKTKEMRTGAANIFNRMKSRLYFHGNAPSAVDIQSVKRIFSEEKESFLSIFDGMPNGIQAAVREAIDHESWDEFILDSTKQATTAKKLTQTLEEVSFLRTKITAALAGTTGYDVISLAISLVKYLNENETIAEEGRDNNPTTTTSSPTKIAAGPTTPESIAEKKKAHDEMVQMMNLLEEQLKSRRRIDRNVIQSIATRSKEILHTEDNPFSILSQNLPPTESADGQVLEQLDSIQHANTRTQTAYRRERIKKFASMAKERMEKVTNDFCLRWAREKFPNQDHTFFRITDWLRKSIW